MTAEEFLKNHEFQLIHANMAFIAELMEQYADIKAKEKAETEQMFRNFIRKHYLSRKWDEYLKEYTKFQQQKDKQMTAEETIKKLERIDRLSAKAFHYHNHLVQMGKTHLFDERWRKRLSAYRIKLLTTFSKELCEEQKRLCNNEILPETGSQFEEIVVAIKEHVDKAPLPDILKDK